MAATAQEDGVRSHERGQRGCEHYDRGCLLKVTTSVGFSPTSFRRVRLGTQWAKRLGLGLFEVALFVRIPAPSPGTRFH